MCRPIKSRALWVQISGRGLRISPGKDDCWFFDFCGNIKRLGMPTASKKLKLCPSNRPQSEEEIITTKQCPECESIIPIYEKICPHCLYVFPAKKSLADDAKRKFEEVLSPEQKKQVRYIKIRAINAYNERQPIDIENEFALAFKYQMPEEWYDGLIFNSDDTTWTTSLQHYWRYLLLVNVNPNSIETRTQIDKSIRREFRTQIENAAKSFTFSLQSTSFQTHEIEAKVAEEIKRLIAYKSWWVILGAVRPIAAENIFTAYMVVRNTRLAQLHDNPSEIMAYGELLDMAVSEGIEYYAIDQPTIDEHVRAIKDGIKFKRYTLICEYIKNLSPTEKERVWTELTPHEKSAYREWKEANTCDSIKPHTIEVTEEPKLQVEPENTQNYHSTTTINKIVDGTSNRHYQPDSIVSGVQLTLFTETETDKELNDTLNPMRLHIGDIVTNTNPRNNGYKLRGKIIKVHNEDKRLCQVYYPATSKYSWCRYVDLCRV